MATGGLVGLTVLGVGGLAAAIGLTFHAPSDVEPIEVVQGPAPTLKPGGSLKVLVWNVQFAAGRNHEFFYDGGETVSVSAAEVETTLQQIIETIRRQDPDIVLLQEIDRDSRRTGFVDQHARLVEALQYPAHATTPYHRVPYVPTPSHEHLGRVDMHLTVMSRYRLGAATRHQLALLNEPGWRQMFNLRRALMEVEVPLEGGGSLTLLNTHLSAFSGGDDTLDKQLDQIHQRTQEIEGPWILAGDFNALPPGDDPARLPDGEHYAPDSYPIQLLFDHATPAVPLAELQSAPQPWRTYVDYQQSTPDRTIDYVFYGPGVEGRTFVVDTRAAGVSDHLPMVSTIALP
jgi:endonuclease/exonuclease/phosphatase family metal-dependent hydrolase